MTIRELTADDLETYRLIRLAALRVDPGAFGSTHERESAFSDDEWAARLAGFGGRPGAVFVHESEGSALGMAGAGITDEPTDAMVWGMWVAPEARRSGVGRSLLDATIGWADQRGLQTLTLWVMRTNDSARALYEQVGFEATGDVQPAPSDPCADELAMRLNLGRRRG